MTSAGGPRVAVVIPALDEEEALPHVLRALRATRADLVVVVDNGSADRTGDVAREHGALVRREERRGYGAACLKALALLDGREPLARGEEGFEAVLPLRDEDVVVFLDGDGSDDASELALLVAPILEGRADFVLGARDADARSRTSLSPQQRFGNALACALLRVLFGARHRDLGPFRAIRCDALRHLSMRDRDYGWTIEMQIKARVARLRVAEVAVHYRPRVAGESKISGTIAGAFGAGRKILGWILGWRLRLLSSSRAIPRFR